MDRRVAFTSNGHVVGTGPLIAELCFELYKIGGELPACPILAHLSRSSAIILLELRDGSKTQAELSEVLTMDKGQVSRAIAELRRDGDIANPSERARGNCLSLSDRGNRLAREASNSLTGKWFTNITKFKGQLSAKMRLLAKAIVETEFEIEPENIRRGSIAELARFATIAIQTVELGVLGNFGHGVIPYIYENCAQAAGRPNDYLFLVADYQEGIYGGLLAVLRRHEKNADLRMLAVDPRVIGHRLGTALVEEMATILRKGGYVQVEVSCLPETVGFFRESGWEKVERDNPASTRFGVPYVRCMKRLA